MTNPNKRLIMPSARGKTYVQFFYSGQDKPFICGADGHVTSDMLDDVERDFLEEWNPDNDEIFKGAGDYLFQVNFEPAQRGEFGRIEIGEYWNVSFLQFEPLVN